MKEVAIKASQIKRVHKALSMVPYAKLLGIELDEVGYGTATLSLPVRKELTQNHGVVHGGATASLIDSAMALAIIPLLGPKEKVTTVDLTISYLRPVTTGQMKASAKVLRSGRRLICVTAEVVNSDQTLIATALSTYIRV
ncbi:MAG TPA: PaaI family thioesterase [Pyrinomonadaceae bacterium]|nr:PaaI family thioesterase [Pyrinomonadaceae bacterium]